MGYAITGAAGLLVGIGFLIWALRERSARHKAEKATAVALSERGEALRVADSNIKIVKNVREYNIRLSEQVIRLRGQLNETRMRLAKAGNPKAIKEWLDKELEAEEL